MTQRRDLQALIDAAPVGKMQWRVIICCFLVVMLDGFDTAAIGFIAPDIRTHWQLSASELAPLFGAGLLGLTAGALLCGPLADRFGRKRVIELCVALFGALSLLSAFSPDIETLVLLRFLTGLGLGGAMPNTITMTSEYLPAGRYAANYRKPLSPGRSAPLPASAITIRNSFCMRRQPSPKAVFASFLPGNSLSLP